MLLARRKNEWGRKHIKNWRFWLGSPRKSDGKLVPNVIVNLEDVPVDLQLVGGDAPCEYPQGLFPVARNRRRDLSDQETKTNNTVTQRIEGNNILREHIIHV